MLGRGIIPAYAGQIILPLREAILDQDHPRIRGTNLFPVTCTEIELGSSPHTRDKFRECLNKLFDYRIIPAYAGQIRIQLEKKKLRQDHPRIRGTNIIITDGTDTSVGSSPHTRDKLEYPFIDDDMYRIIPAYAGQILRDPLK